jgi:hypothetical protein
MQDGEEEWPPIMTKGHVLKVPKCEIYDRFDFHYFYTLKSPWVGDFGTKI